MSTYFAAKIALKYSNYSIHHGQTIADVCDKIFGDPQAYLNSFCFLYNDSNIVYMLPMNESNKVLIHTVNQYLSQTWIVEVLYKRQDIPDEPLELKECEKENLIQTPKMPTHFMVVDSFTQGILDKTAFPLTSEKYTEKETYKTYFDAPKFEEVENRSFFKPFQPIEYYLQFFFNFYLRLNQSYILNVFYRIFLNWH